MGKDRSGKYHPPKGKPSGAGKDEGGLGIHPTEPEKMEQYLDITDRYTTGEDEVAPHVPVRHPNRNTEKGHTRFKNQQDEQDSRKSDDQTFTEERSQAVPEELPRILTKEQFAELANYKNDLCISLYIPTHTAGVEVNEHFDPITFKQSLQEIAGLLKNKGHNQATIERLLEPGYTLLRDDAFWSKMTQGLAVFIANDHFKYMKLPMAIEREVVVENSFFVTPLVQLMTRKEYFYTLVISKKQVKLYKADEFGMEFIPVPGLPDGMLDAQAPDKDDETTFRTGGRGGTGGANFHGIGGGNNVDDKQKIATYFETADDVIWKEVLHTENAPLLLAGVEYLIPIYRSVSDYKNIYEDALTGSHEREDIPTLYKQAMEKMAPYFQQRLKKALDMYGNQSATPLASCLETEIIPAAHYGRVSHLFVQKGAHVWGTFDEMANELKLDETGAEGAEDLLDHAVVKTLLTGGEVFLVDKEQMPKECMLAAIMRY